MQMVPLGGRAATRVNCLASLHEAMGGPGRKLIHILTRNFDPLGRHRCSGWGSDCNHDRS